MIFGKEDPLDVGVADGVRDLRGAAGVEAVAHLLSRRRASCRQTSSSSGGEAKLLQRKLTSQGRCPCQRAHN